MDPRDVRRKGKKAMKTQQHPEQQPRRVPCPEWPMAQLDKGRKHEAFEAGFGGGDRRSLARAGIRFDRKR